MNNYTNMNYYVPNDFTYTDAMEMKKQLNNMMVNNNNKVMEKKEKTSINPNNNLKFNVCNYNQKVSPNDLYDVYNGFIRGNMFPELYNQYKVNKPFEVEALNEQGQLLTYIDAYSFAAHELNLYLDNNPEDKKMIELFNQYSTESQKAREEYERKFGPLFVDQSNSYPWAWNQSPWPWENR